MPVIAPPSASSSGVKVVTIPIVSSILSAADVAVARGVVLFGSLAVTL